MTGLFYVVLAQVFWAGELVFVRKFFPTQNPIFISAVSSFAGSLFYLPLFFATKQAISRESIFLLIILGIVSWVIPQIFYIKGIQMSSNAFAVSLTTLSMPFFAVLLSAIFLKEPITWKLVAGGLLMMLGFIVVSLP